MEQILSLGVCGACRRKRCSMKAELLADSTYKITLDKYESAEMPSDGEPCEMRRYLSGLIDRLGTEQDVLLPDGRLLVETFMRSDGSCVLFVSPLEGCSKTASRTRYYACELSGVEYLLPLVSALSDIDESCCIFCGSKPDHYRIIFADPSEQTERVCTEFGEYCEISALFAAQTREYLTEIACGSASALARQLG